MRYLLRRGPLPNLAGCSANLWLSRDDHNPEAVWRLLGVATIPYLSMHEALCGIFFSEGTGRRA